MWLQSNSRLGAVAASTAALALPSAASAAQGPCIPGTEAPKCHIWTGKAGAVDDGDTINAKIAGDGAREWRKIRLTGIQAMELTRYGKKRGRRGECNGVRAAEVLERLIRAGNSRVRIAAHDPSSTTGERGRLRRSIAVRADGAWHDVGRVLIESGLALWFPNPVEWAWNRSYSRLAEQAAARRVGIWNTASCGAGPSPAAQLWMKVRWDAEDLDSRNINGEWARITNLDPANAVPIGRWWFRDSHLRRYTFPRGAEIPPGGSVQIHAGTGSNSASDFYWGLDETIFENVTDDAKQIGDGGYLFDPEGDLRAWVQYPCRTNCPDPLENALDVEATAKAPEYVTVQNVSSERLDLAGTEIESRPWFYEISRGTALDPGERFKLWIKDGRESELVKSWGFDRYLLGDKKDVVTIRNSRGEPVACDAWGGANCPKV